jgi:hypothetical protein
MNITTEQLRLALANAIEADAAMGGDEPDGPDRAALNDRRARERLVRLICHVMGPPPWAVTIDGYLVCRTVENDGLALFGSAPPRELAV